MGYTGTFCLLNCTQMLFCCPNSVHLLISLTTVVNVKWVMDSVSVCEGVNQTVELFLKDFSPALFLLVWPALL